jgi:hypothetical protein
MSSKTRRFIAGAVALCLAGTLFYIFLEGDPAGQATDREVEVDGKITSVEPIFSSNQDNRFEIVVEFTDADSGQVYAAKERITVEPAAGQQGSGAGGVDVGDSRTIAYDPADPTSARVLNEPTPKIVLVALGIAALIFAIASFAGVDFIGLGSRLTNRRKA